MFADPQSVTYNGTTYTLPRVSLTGRTAEYADSTSAYFLDTNHSVGKRTRDQIRFKVNKIASDPYTTGRSLPVGMQVILTVDSPLIGFTYTEKLEATKTLLNLLAASTYSAAGLLISGQS